MTETDIQSIGLFFFFALLDEQKAIEASARAYNQIQNRLSRSPDIETSVAIVIETKNVWEKYKNRGLSTSPFLSVAPGWNVTENLGPWREFQKRSREDELLAVIWSKILLISDEDIAEGLASTRGTVRYRLGIALRKMGNIVQKTGKFKDDLAEK